MHILLTDLLACPRCGPDFGLLVQADRLEDRRVVAGRLACPNCRETYPVRDALADLRVSPPDADARETDGAAPADEEAAVRLAALMGLSGANGMVVVVGPGARHAAAVSALVPDVEVVAVDTAPRGGAAPGVSRLAAEGLPVRSGLLRAAALTGGADDAALREALRVLAPGARLVVDPAPAGTAEALAGLGAEVVLDQQGVVVARAPGRPIPLRHNLVR